MGTGSEPDLEPSWHKAFPSKHKRKPFKFFMLSHYENLSLSHTQSIRGPAPGACRWPLAWRRKGAEQLAPIQAHSYWHKINAGHMSKAIRTVRLHMHQTDEKCLFQQKKKGLSPSKKPHKQMTGFSISPCTHTCSVAAAPLAPGCKWLMARGTYRRPDPKSAGYQRVQTNPLCFPPSQAKSLATWAKMVGPTSSTTLATHKCTCLSQKHLAPGGRVFAHSQKLISKRKGYKLVNSRIPH